MEDSSKKAIDTGNNFVNYVSAETAFCLAFSNNEGRADWRHHLMELERNILTIIHPTAYVSPKSTIVAGMMGLPGAIVNTECPSKAGMYHQLRRKRQLRLHAGRRRACVPGCNVEGSGPSAVIYEDRIKNSHQQ